MSQSKDVASLLNAAAQAPTLADQQRLVGDAERIRTAMVAQSAVDRELDLAGAIVTDHLTPVRVHEHHTAATDWLGAIDTSPPTQAAHEMIAQGSVWYSKLPEVVKQHPDELTQQALGFARRLAGKYGSGAEAAEAAFLDHVGGLHGQDVAQGLVVVAASGLPQIGEPGAPVADATVGPPGATGLPEELTSSSRAPTMQALEQNATGGDDPSQLPQSNVDVINNDEGDRSEDRIHASISRKEASMPHITAACPECSGCQACGGTHRVAVRGPRTAASGLPQIDQTVDSNNQPAPAPYPTEVAFPWEMDPSNQGNAIQETEQQLREREQRKGAAVRAARHAAQQAYLRTMAGQDDSGWAGNMGAGGVGPGQQDGGNPGTTYPGNLADPDPVYGTGGDNPDQPLTPYGADEANDFTNNPGMNYQPGQPTQYDQGGRVNPVGQTTGRRSDVDPEIQRALAFVRQRRELVDSQS